MKFGRKHVILAVALFSLVCVVGLYVAQAHYGICIREGRVLSPEELRERVLLNLINLEIKNANDNNWYMGNDFSRAGIVNSASDLDIRKILMKVYSSEKSVENNLGLDPLIKRRIYGEAKLYLAEQIKEPFILITYRDDYSSSEGGGIYISTDIHETDFHRTKDKLIKKGLISKISFYINALRGYNNHYFSVKPYLFSRKCCNKKITDEVINKKRRLKEFEENMDRIERFQYPGDFKIRIAAISNCGDILTEPHDMGLPTRNIRWVH